MTLPFIIIRADASARIGTGHIMRTLALIHAWQEIGGDALLVAAEIPDLLKQRLSKEGISTIGIDFQPGSEADARQLCKLSEDNKASWIIVDGYQFGSDYQKYIKEAGNRVLFVDDYGHAEHYYADIVLNQNIYANNLMYPNIEAYTRLLLGTRYSLLRREFWSWQNSQRQFPETASKILITLGGSDQDNVTGNIIDAFNLVSKFDLEIKVIVGGANPNICELRDKVNKSPHKIRLIENTTKMPELMAWADLAISAGGSTVWELCLLGTPSLIFILADNQKNIAKGLHKAGAAVHFDSHDNFDVQYFIEQVRYLLEDMILRERISEIGQNMVDGRGAFRTVQILKGKPCESSCSN
ncbi:UDP-2,4-diacetamido-2,4,6-trideoxy-beta-L-altropyranose hydrolase [Thermodesulfobacteriota bacterium]